MIPPECTEGCRRVRRTYPQLRPAPVGDDVVDVPVVAQAQGGTAHEGAHVQGEDGDEQGLSALQVAVEQDGDENNLGGDKNRSDGGTDPSDRATEARPEVRRPHGAGFRAETSTRRRTNSQGSAPLSRNSGPRTRDRGRSQSALLWSSCLRRLRVWLR